MSTVQIAVPDITCEHCVRSVDGALRGVTGVTDVRVDLANKAATVEVADGTEPAAVLAALLQAVEEAGYSPAIHPASDG